MNTGFINFPNVERKNLEFIYFCAFQIISPIRVRYMEFFKKNVRYMANIYLKKLKGGSKEIWEMKCVFFFLSDYVFSKRSIIVGYFNGKTKRDKKKNCNSCCCC